MLRWWVAALLLASSLAPSSAAAAPSLRPVTFSPVSGPFVAARVVVDHETSCALSVGGRVACWGGGIGAAATTVAQAESPVPLLIDGVDGVLDLALADRALVLVRGDGTVTQILLGAHGGQAQVEGVDRGRAVTPASSGFCALQADGGVRCWGWIGWLDGATDRWAARPVPDLAPARLLACDSQSCCAQTGRDLVCRGASVPPGREPAGPADARATLALGSGAACVTSSEGARCWGRGATDPEFLPTGTRPGEIRSITLGGDRRCVVEADGAARCTTRDEPLVLRGVAQVALTDGHACAVTVAGGVRCWGSNAQGQLGSGGPLATHVPGLVPGIEGATQLSVRHGGACAGGDRTLWCWGDGGSSASSVLVGRSPLFGGQHLECVADDRRLRCGGLLQRGQWAWSPLPDTAGPIVAATSDRALTICAATQDGAIACLFSRGEDGIDERWRPLRGPVAPIELAATAAGVIARGEGGRVWQWSDERWDGDPDFVRLPGAPRARPVGTIQGATAIGAGQSHACAIADDELLCWGSVGFSGEFFSSSEPRAVPGMTGASAVGANHHHLCAIVGGEVLCIGENDHGQLGAPPSEGSRVPVPVPLPRAAVKVGVGREHSCALLESGEVWCWGRDEDGQLGRSRPLRADRPVDVVGVGR